MARKVVYPQKKKVILLSVFLVIILAFIANCFYSRAFSVLPDVAVYLMDSVKEPSNYDRVLVISPHPDDETIAAAAYIQRAVNNGAEVMVALVTDANYSGIGKERLEEFRRAMTVLGLKESQLVFLNIQEKTLTDQSVFERAGNQLKKEIDNFLPTIVIYPDKNDKHPDHYKSAELVNVLIGDRNDILKYRYLVHYKYFPQPIGLKIENNLAPPVKLVNFSSRWLKFNLSSQEIEKKLEALSCYQTQLRKPLLHNLLISMVRKNELFVVDN